MPAYSAYFQLFKRGSTKPYNLNKLDEEICSHIGCTIHPDKYAFGWFDSIGFRIAARDMPLGSQALRDQISELVHKYDCSPELIQILEYLESRFESTAWTQIGK